MKLSRRQQLLILISLILIILLGLGSKFYQGWGEQWINDRIAGVWYEIFWCLLFFLWFPSRKNQFRIPFIVFTVTCFVEVLQLWHPPLLEYFRSFLMGKFLLGTTFSWGDFFYYVIGCLLGWLLLRIIGSQSSRIDNG
ncbi:MAG: DUF2809 domain-containing protein [Microcystaceae cyanobacterium]